MMVSLNEMKSNSTATATSTASHDVFDPNASSETALALVPPSGAPMPPTTLALALLVSSPVLLPLPTGKNVASGSTSGAEKPKARGKVQLRRVEKGTNRMVTFSKRKAGIFKKASELSRLCGVQSAVVVFSPAGKAYSFGYPSADLVIDGYLTGNHPNSIPPSAGPSLMTQNLIERSKNKELADLIAALEAAKERGKILEERKKERKASCWWERPVQELNAQEKETLKHALKDMSSYVSNMARLCLAHSPSTSYLAPSSLLQGSGPNLHSGFHGYGALPRPPSAGFSNWNHRNGVGGGLDEAGPSGHAPGGWKN